VIEYFRQWTSEEEGEKSMEREMTRTLRDVRAAMWFLPEALHSPKSISCRISQLEEAAALRENSGELDSNSEV
jgi:hypothetical protein